MTNPTTDTLTIAAIIRNLTNANLTRNELKVHRARLRRMGVTNLNKARRNAPYKIIATSDERSDKRADAGVVVVGAVAEALIAA